jgi:hypothetical protein
MHIVGIDPGLSGAVAVLTADGTFQALYDTPNVWKKAMGLKADKEQARLRAMQLFPTAALRRKKHHNRAEALLLALDGQRHICLTLQALCACCRYQELGTRP